jgi:hypothetical protein
MRHSRAFVIFRYWVVVIALTLAVGVICIILLLP